MAPLPANAAREVRVIAKLLAYQHGVSVPGAVVADAATGEVWSVPVVPNLHIVDVTGCGNAFCGGFLASRQAGDSAWEAAVWGTAAASHMAECAAVPTCSPTVMHTAAVQRATAVRQGVRLLVQ